MLIKHLIISVLGLLDHLWLLVIGFTGGLVVKNLHTNAGDTEDSGSIPGLERSPGGGNGNPLQYCCLENMDRGAWLVTANGVTVRHDWACMHRTTVQSWSCTPEQQELWNNQCLSIIMFLLRKNRVFLKGEIIEINHISHTLPLLGLCPEELAWEEEVAFFLLEIFYVLNWISLGCDVPDVFHLSFIF